MRKYLSNLVKIGVSVIGLLIVMAQVDFSDIWDTLLRTHRGWVLVGFVLVNVSLVVRAFRWLLLLRSLGVELSFVRLVELYFVGNFFNAFLPSGFGGDVVRVLEVARDVPTSTATGTVILDRLTGLIMLFVMAVLVIPLRPASFPNALMTLIIVGLALGIVAGLLLLEGRLLQRFGRWLPGPLSPVKDTPVARLLHAVQQCSRRAIWGALAVSVFFNLLLSGWWFATGMALRQDIAFSYYVLVMPVLSVPLLIPSISGLGPRELLAPMLFGVAGVTTEVAVTLSLLVFVINRLSGLIGAPIYILATIRDSKVKNEPASQQIANES